MEPYAKYNAGTSAATLRHQQLDDHRANVSAAIRKPFERLARDYRSAARKLFTRKDLRALPELSQQFREQYRSANLKAGIDGAKWTAHRQRALARLRRELRRAIPKYRAWEALAKAYGRDYKKLRQQQLAALVDPRVHINLDDVLPPHEGEIYEFTPPYALQSLAREDDPEASVDDLSVAVPESGTLVNRIHFAQYDVPILWTEILTFDWFARHTSTTACGIVFHMPADGRLRIRATLQNFYSNIVVAIRENFGFSEGAIRVDVRLVITVTQPGQAIELRTTLITDGYDSPGGKDATYYFPPIDNTMPQVFETITDDVFPAATRLEILAGTQIFIFSHIDDMETQVELNLGWQLQKLTLSVEP